MKLKDTQIIESLQEAVILAMKQWLNENKQDVLGTFKQALADRAVVSEPKDRKSNDAKSFLTPAQLAARWDFHAESVRRMMRTEKWPVIRVGSRILIPISAIEKYESEGARHP